jgi:hypothetical protein
VSSETGLVQDQLVHHGTSFKFQTHVTSSESLSPSGCVMWTETGVSKNLWESNQILAFTGIWMSRNLEEGSNLDDYEKINGNGAPCDGYGHAQQPRG